MWARLSRRCPAATLYAFRLRACREQQHHRIVDPSAHPSALLRDYLGLRGRYRKPAKRQKASHFGLSADHDAALSDWMRSNLLATYWEMTTPAVPLDDVETEVLSRLKPPLNIRRCRINGGGGKSSRHEC